MFKHGIDPLEFTKIMTRLREHPPEGMEGIRCSELEHPSLPNPTRLYSFGRPKESHFDHLHAVYDHRQVAMPSSFLRSAGELYVRSLFKALPDDYHEVTRKSRLGKTGSGNAKGADLFVTEIATNQRFAVSVKNQGAWMSRGASAIDDVFAKARNARAKPWLFVSFALPDVHDRCNSDGIRLTVLDRQMVHAEDHRGFLMSWVLKKVWEVHGPQPFGIVYQRFSRTKQSAATQRDLESLRRCAKAAL